MSRTGSKMVITERVKLLRYYQQYTATNKANYKQLLDEVFVISRIIKVEVRVISRS